ncbi:MAG: GNAT family N-acetyltransferase [Actinomycetota bacterium]
MNVLQLHPIEVRQLGETDAHHIEGLFNGLSDQDRYFRFFRPMPTYPTAVMDLLTGMDGIDHVAVGAFVDGTCAGVARFIRSTRRPTVAEVAVSVADGHRGMGLARRLVAALDVLAVDRDIERFEIYVHPGNRPAAQLFRSLGFTLVLDSGTLEGERRVGAAEPAPALAA